LAKRCIEVAHSKGKSPQQLTDVYMSLSDELNENRMEIYRYINDNPTDYYSAYTEEEWEEFYDRSEVHYDRLRLEGEIFKSLLPKLNEVKHPMLLITAEHDAATCDNQINSFKQNAKQGLIYHFQDCGHTPHYEHPEHFKKVVIDFLS